MRNFSPAEIVFIHENFEILKPREIAAKLLIAVESIREYMNANDLESCCKPTRLTDDQKKYIELHSESKTIDEIRKALKCGYSMVYNHIKKKKLNQKIKKEKIYFPDQQRTTSFTRPPAEYSNPNWQNYYND
jgi:predicted DNA-binding protein YlxM (UPF0122 family)